MSPISRPQRHARILAVGVVAALALTGCSGVNGGSTGGDDGGGGGELGIRLATWIGPATPYGVALEEFVATVDELSDGEITIEPFWDGALLAGPELLSGAGDGRADLAYLPTHYNPAELPLSQLTTVPFLTSDVPAAEATWETLLESDEAFAAEYAESGVTPLTVHGTTTNILATTEPVPDFDWLDGRSLRATSYSANAVQLAGANPVALALNEIYESVERGVVEGFTTMNLGTIPSVSLQEATPYVVDAGLGMYATSLLVANTSFWDGLSEDHKAVLTEAIDTLDETYWSVLSDVEEEACSTILDEGGQVTVWPEDEQQRWQDAVGDSILDEWKAQVEAQGVDADAFYDSYMDSLDENATDYVDGVVICAQR